MPCLLKRLFLPFVLLLIIFTQLCFAYPMPNPFPLFRIAGNLYYVGINDLTSYLVMTPKGNILINSSRKIEKTNKNWLDIKKVLSKCSERDLINLVSALYTLSQSNKDFLEARFIKNDNTLSRYKELVKKYIAPNEPWKNNQQVSLKEAKKAISNYKKATNDKIGLIDLMICYVEYGTDFLCEFGDMYEQYYCSLESVFSNTLKLMQDLEAQEAFYFKERLGIVVKKAGQTGWGYYDAISDMLDTTYA